MQIIDMIIYRRVKTMEKVSIFNHLRYRDWIRSHLKSLPKKGYGELTRLSEHLGCNTTLVSQIMSGSRDFSDEQSLEVTRFFGLTGLEKEYFFLLVQFEKAATPALKNYIQEKLNHIKSEALELKNRVVADRKLSDQERAIFYSNWLYSAIRLYSSIGNGKSLEEICEKFRLSRMKAQEILNFLVSIQLCEIKGGKYKMTTQSTFVEQTSPHYQKHLANWRIRSITSAETSDPNDMIITAPMSLSEKDFEFIRETLMQTLKQVLSRVKDSKEETTACLLIDFFKF